MLSFDKDFQMQHNFDCLEVVCKTWMEHYNFILGLPHNTDVDKFFYQEHLNQVKWYDV